MKTTKSEKKVLYSNDPEWYGFEWSDKHRDFVLLEDGETRLWRNWENEYTSWGWDCMLEALPNVKNDLVVEIGVGSAEVEPFLVDAIMRAGPRYGVAEVTVIDGDLYSNDCLIRELTDRGQDWFDRNSYSGSSNQEEAWHCMEAAGMTRKVFGRTKRESTRNDDRWFDPERHPLAKVHPRGPLYTIDRGPGYGSYRFMAAAGDTGSEGLPAEVGNDYSLRGMSWESGYREGEALAKRLEPGKRAVIGTGAYVTRVRSTKRPAKSVSKSGSSSAKHRTAKKPATRTVGKSRGAPAKRRATKGARRRCFRLKTTEACRAPCACAGRWCRRGDPKAPRRATAS